LLPRRRFGQEKRARAECGTPKEFSALHPLLPSCLGNPLDRKVETGRKPAKIPWVGDTATLDFVHRLAGERTVIVLQDGRTLCSLSRLFE